MLRMTREDLAQFVSDMLYSNSTEDFLIEKGIVELLPDCLDKHLLSACAEVSKFSGQAGTPLGLVLANLRNAYSDAVDGLGVG